jgi:hypothetical protein
MAKHTGDMSIAEQYVGNGNMPVNQPPFYGISTGFKSICVTTRDQGLPMVSGYSPSSPTCFYEFDLRFCRKWKWIYFPGWYTSTPVLNDEFVESSTNLRAGARPSYEDSTTIKETDVTDVFEPVIKKIPLNEVIGVDKIVQAVIEVTGNKSFQAGPTPTDADGLVDAIQIDDVFAQYNQKYTQILCPQKFCWIPFYAECRKGGYTAHGSGPENLKITGGSYDFYGGFGQVSILLHDYCMYHRDTINFFLFLLSFLTLPPPALLSATTAVAAGAVLFYLLAPLIHSFILSSCLVSFPTRL